MAKAGETPTKGTPEDKEIGKMVFIVKENSFEVLVSNTISTEEAYDMMVKAMDYLASEFKQTSNTVH